MPRYRSLNEALEVGNGFRTVAKSSQMEVTSDKSNSTARTPALKVHRADPTANEKARYSKRCRVFLRALGAAIVLFQKRRTGFLLGMFGVSPKLLSVCIS